MSFKSRKTPTISLNIQFKSNWISKTVFRTPLNRFFFFFFLKVILSQVLVRVGKGV